MSRPLQIVVLVSVALIVGVLLVTRLWFPSPSSSELEALIESGIVLCPPGSFGLLMERFNVGGVSGHDSPERAAAEVRDAIIEAGGRPDGQAIGPLVRFDSQRFLWPRPGAQNALNADGVISVEPAPGGGHLATRAFFFAGAVPHDFSWGGQDE